MLAEISLRDLDLWPRDLENSICSSPDWDLPVCEVWWRLLLNCAVASLTLVSPCAVTDGVTVFFPQKSDEFFYWSSSKVMTCFSRRKYCHLHLPTDRLSSVFCKFSRKNFILSLPCHSPGWCHPGLSAPSPFPPLRPVTPLELWPAGRKQTNKQRDRPTY